MQTQQDKPAQTNWRMGLAVVVGALTISLFIAEAVLLALAGFGVQETAGPSRIDYDKDFSAISGGAIVPDLVSGYRYTPGRHRNFRVINDRLVYDSWIDANAHGYPTTQDFGRSEGMESGRVVVLGDSFTAAEYLDVPWPDRVQENLDASGIPMVLMSHALGGIGLGTWHSQYLSGILPSLDHDILIIAIFGDDLARRFSILMEEEGALLTGRFDRPPVDDDEFETIYRPELVEHPTFVIESDLMDEALVSARGTPWRWPGFGLRLPRLVRTALLTARSLTPDPTVSTAGPAVFKPFSMREMYASYGRAQLEQLETITTAAQDKGVDVILAAVPGRNRLKTYLSRRGGRLTSHQREIRSLALHLGTEYFDGYAPFRGNTAAAVDRDFWLYIDGHWNQRGSDVFAASMAAYLMDYSTQLMRGSDDAPDTQPGSAADD